MPLIHNQPTVSGNFDLGAVEIKDQDSDLRAEVTTAGLAVDIGSTGTTEVTQNNFWDLQTLAYQPTASGLQTTANQSTIGNLKARVYPGTRQTTTSPTIVTISGISARNSSDLAAGNYVLKASVDCNFKQGNSSVVATTFDWPLFAGEESWPQVVTGSSDARFAVIGSGVVGILFIKSTEEV